MNPTSTLLAALVATITLTSANHAIAQSTERAAERADWPQFRGAGARGVADGHRLPSSWDLETGENVLWTTPVPGLAHASPIVAGDRVFVVTAVAAGIEAELKVGLYGAGDSADDMVEHAFRILCLDRDDGSVLWDHTAIETKPKFARHTKATHADSTPVTDGEHVVALFSSAGLFCYDLAGERKWHVDLGDLDVGPHDSLDLHWGFATSPIIADGMVIVQADVKTKPFLAAYDLETGERLWRVDRDDVPGWCTPTAFVGANGLQIVTNGCKDIGGYRAADGTRLWRMAGGGGIPVPAPVVVDDLIYLTSNHRGIDRRHPLKPIFVIASSARGDLGVPGLGEPSEHVAWTQSRHGSYMHTPLVYRGLAYFGKTNGVVGVFDAKTGERRGQRRLGDGRTGFTASAIAGDGKVFFTSEEGDVHVLRAGHELETIATNAMGEICMATPAISGRMILVRTRGHVVAIGAR